MRCTLPRRTSPWVIEKAKWLGSEHDLAGSHTAALSYDEAQAEHALHDKDQHTNHNDLQRRGGGDGRFPLTLNLRKDLCSGQCPISERFTEQRQTGDRSLGSVGWWRPACNIPES